MCGDQDIQIPVYKTRYGETTVQIKSYMDYPNYRVSVTLRANCGVAYYNACESEKGSLACSDKLTSE